MGQVVQLLVAPAERAQMQRVEMVRVIAGLGLEGDRYALGLGSFSKYTDKIRQVSLISLEAIASARIMCRDNGWPEFEIAETRRNIITSGVELLQFVGKEFKVGEVLMRGFGDCTPCEIPAEIAKKPKRFAQVFKGAGGLRAEILSDGYLYEGDVIRW